MNDPGEAFAMWDSGPSHFAWPMTSSPGSAAGTSRAVARLAVGDAQALVWNYDVFCQECRTPLIPADK
eukprot:211245-Prorocentrum_lima.AAC.1